MSDTSATASYTGYGLTVGGWQSRAEARDAEPEAAECGHMVDGDGQIVLEGPNGEGEAFGNRAGDRVANLSVQHVQTEVTKRGLPSDVATNQNALAAGRSPGSRDRTYGSAGEVRGRRGR